MKKDSKSYYAFYFDSPEQKDKFIQLCKKKYRKASDVMRELTDNYMEALCND